MRTRYIVVSFAILSFIIVGYFALEESSIEYGTISTAKKSKKTLQIVGTWYKPDGYKYDSQRDKFFFTLVDDAGDQIPVVFSGAKPNNFELSESIVVKGKVRGDTLYASSILTKCPSKYDAGGAEIGSTKEN